MKVCKLALSALLGLVLGSLSCPGAATDDYVMQNTAGTSTARVAFPGAASRQIRLTSYECVSDTNTADLVVIAGTTPLSVIGLNNATNLQISSTSGIITNRFALINKTDATALVCLILNTNQATNVIVSIASGSIETNDVFWISDGHTNDIGANTVRLSGEALAVAQRRAPLGLNLGPSLSGTGTRIAAAVVHYDRLD